MIVALLFASPQRADCQTLTLQLTPSDYNGYAVSCFGAKDGSLDLTVSGGVSPYFFEWSNGASTEDLSALAAGYYRVGVTDSNGGNGFVEITLEQPEPLNATAVPFEYPNEYHVSCHSCYNGSINAEAEGGVAPYTYTWRDGTLQEDRTSLGARDYSVVVSDANGCTAKEVTVTLREPERNDWTMTGNTGTNPVWQYLGTADNKDLAIGTNGQQRMRILADGSIRMNALSFSEGYTPLWADSTGIIRAMDPAQLALYVADETRPGCPTAKTWPWLMCGNHVLPENFIGSTNAADLKFRTNNEQRMMITAEGRVGIGTIPPGGSLGDYRLFVENGIACRDVLVRLGAWPDYVFADDYDLLTFDALRQYLYVNKHLPGIPAAVELEEQGGVEMGDMQRRLLKVVEEQALYILKLEESLRAIEQRLKVLESTE